MFQENIIKLTCCTIIKMQHPDQTNLVQEGPNAVLTLLELIGIGPKTCILLKSRIQTRGMLAEVATPHMLLWFLLILI